MLSGKYVITSAENFQRFCSNYLATEKEGFDRPILFTNEEAQDWVRRSGVAWDGSGTLPGGFFAPGAAGTEQAGVVVAHDVQNGKTRPIYGMGRHNHENSVAIPGFDKVVVLSGDDTFNTTPFTFAGAHPRKTDSWSQLYMYIADDSDDVWNDGGDLYAFQSDEADSYYDLAPGSDPVSGRFVKVPKDVATGKHASGRELLAADFGMDAPPAGTPDGPQWVLDQWVSRSTTTTARTSSASAARLPRLRQATGQGEHRLHRRLGARSPVAAVARHAVPLDQRPDLEDGAERERPDDRRLARDPRRG